MRENQRVEKWYVNQLGNVLNSFNDIDKACIIVAGDLSYSGQQNEFRNVGKLFGQLSDKLREKFGNKYIPFYIVPGNHDIEFKGNIRERSELMDLHNSGKIDSMIDEELNRFTNFYNFAERNRCFKQDKLLGITSFLTGECCTQINLINSELFSTFRDLKGDDDKGLHYFPEDRLSRLIKKTWSKYSITVMHRSPEWFSWQSSQDLKNRFYKSSNILICGHEHINEVQDINNKDLIFIKSGTFDFLQKEFCFNLITIDTDNNECCVSTYKWDKENSIFLNIESSSRQIHEIVVDDELKPNSDFSSDFLDYNSYKLDDVFVFPDLDKCFVQDKNEKSIRNMEELYDIINENQITYIEGDVMSGKTMLARALYKYFIIKRKVPLYLDIEENDKKVYDNMILDVFCHQYSYDKEVRERFNQTLKDDKVILIDNFEKLSEDVADGLIIKLKQDFKKIIILQKPKYISNIVESTKQNIIDENNTIARLKILPFYLRKRKELIRTILRNSVTKVDNIDEKVSEINNFISNQIQIFSLNPNFISMYVNHYTDDVKNTDLQTNVFSKVFEANIIRSLMKYIKNESVDEYFALYENLAYKMHFSKKYPITYSDIKETIDDYNSDFMMEIDISKFRKVSIRANILEELDNDTFRFSDDTYLAYFVACALNKRANNGEIKDELTWICTNICFNINGDILLFLSYITKNVSILDFVFESAQLSMREWVEFDIINNDIQFLSTDFEKTFSLPTLEEKNKHEEMMEEQEKGMMKSIKIKTKSIYDDYDDNKLQSKNYKIQQSLRYLELICKILPNFNHMLQRDKKMELINGIYKFPNQICNEAFKDIDLNLNKMIENLLHYCQANNITINKEKILSQLQYESEIFLLNIFDMTARLSTNAKTIKILDTMNLKNVNYELLNIMMHENLGNFEDFAKRADKMYDKSKNVLVKTMIKRVIRKHFLCNKGIKQINYVQKIADKFFGNNRKFL